MKSNNIFQTTRFDHTMIFFKLTDYCKISDTDSWQKMPIISVEILKIIDEREKCDTKCVEMTQSSSEV